jgi:glycosyltransferase involved in cell wall biosynthesis
MPELSVLLPVRDAGTWLAAAAASLARQTFRDYEVVAIDDGSLDGSGERLERIAERDPRWRVTRTPPRGLPRALATAMASARAPFLARHDADDLSHRTRFARQMEYLRIHPRVAVVGSRLRLFPRPEIGLGMRRWARWHDSLLSHEAMAAEACIDNPLLHGTAVMRRAAVERAGGWVERGWAEDHDLTLRLLESGARLAKLDATLYGWRQHATSATRQDPRYSRERFMDLKLDHLGRGLLRGARGARLLGIGASLDRWRRALEDRGLAVEARSMARPAPRLPAGIAPPVLLVFTAPVAREQWRRSLHRSDMRELTDFVFVA